MSFVVLSEAAQALFEGEADVDRLRVCERLADATWPGPGCAGSTCLAYNCLWQARFPNHAARRPEYRGQAASHG